MIWSLVTIFVLHAAGFIYASRYKSDHLTDIIYASSFIVLAWLVLFPKPFQTPQLILAILITLWGLRLGIYLGYRIQIWGQDRRFDEFRKSWKSLIKFWILQFVSIQLIGLPLYLYLSKSMVEVNYLTWIGGSICLTGLLIEAISDLQKFRFKQEHPGQFMSKGLWSYSRHPNYFGEFLVWLGIFIFCVPSWQSWDWISVISPVWVFILVRYISGARLLEESADKKYGQLNSYQNYKQQTPIFFPSWSTPKVKEKHS